MQTTINVYNQSVGITTKDNRLIRQLESFLDKYYTVTQKGFGANNDNVVSKIFASIVSDTNTVILHSNQFTHFLHFLQIQGETIKDYAMEDHRDYKEVKEDYVIRPKWQLRDDQKPVNEFLKDNPVKSKLVPLSTGSGKAQPLDALVKVPDGWVTMGSLSVGDTVIAYDGTKTKVNGVFPQGVKPVYRLTFSDGRSCEASDEHLWRVFVANERDKTRRWKIIDTLELKRLTEKPQPRAYIDLPEPEKNPDVELPLDPYVMGVLLGDGSFRNNNIKLTNSNDYIINKVKEKLPASVTLKQTDEAISYRIVRTSDYEGKDNPLVTLLRELGLMECHSHTKFIPNIYLQGSYNQKLELIQGMLDTDGTSSATGGAINYSTSSFYMAKQFQNLIRSIGGLAYISEKYPYYTYKGQRLPGKTNYRVFVRFRKPESLFTLPYKKEKENDQAQYASKLKLRVINVEYIGDKECQCISIDHPEHLYITNDFIVTHNTVIALYTIGELKSRLGIVVLPQFLEKWVSDIMEIHDSEPMDTMLIQGSKSLAGLVNMAKEGNLPNKYFLFSSRTMQDYITMYENTPELCVDMYGVAPIDLFPLLGIGILLIDETHMAFHAIYKTIINTNVKYQIGLSGTLISEDSVVSRAHRVVYPKSVTYHDTMQKRYMDIYAIAFGINPGLIQSKRIKTTNYGATFYSHIAFEKSILKEKRFLSDYYRVIKGVIEDYYIPDYDKRDSMIIYVATIKMADTILALLKSDYPDKDIVRYCESDDYDTMIAAEIVVTTPQSLSTGIDKPNLRVVIQTVSISSEVTNVQSAGRLRDLKDRDTKFCYLYSDNLPKHREYHKKREQMFAHRCKTFSLRRSRYSIN